MHRQTSKEAAWDRRPPASQSKYISMLASDHFSYNELKGQERNVKKKIVLHCRLQRETPAKNTAHALGGTFIFCGLIDVSSIPLHSSFHFIHFSPAFIWQCCLHFHNPQKGCVDLRPVSLKGNGILISLQTI